MSRTPSANRPFIGFGDPLLKHSGPLSALPLLPETAEELLDLAAEFGSDTSTVLLGERATKAYVQSADLSAFRIIVFATHALGPGSVASLTEPALVLTPNGDDGLLRSSEIASLKIEADLVVLSTSNAEGFSSTKNQMTLDEAFLFAGARSVMVSQLALSSTAAETLTVRTVAAIELDPLLGWAEALRRSMLLMLDDRARPEFAHPAFWGGFEITSAN